MNFSEFLSLNEFIHQLDEGLGVFSRNFLEELKEDIEASYNQIVKYATVPTRKDGSMNWLNINLTYWTQPKHKEELIQKTYDKIMPMVGINTPRRNARVYARDYMTSVWQKDVGFGSRRFANYAGKIGYTQPMIHPAAEPLIKPRAMGRQANKYKWENQPDGTRKLVLKNPAYPNY